MAAGRVLGSNDRPSGVRGATHRLIGKGGMIVRPSFCSSKKEIFGEGWVDSTGWSQPVHITSRLHASALPILAVAWLGQGQLAHAKHCLEQAMQTPGTLPALQASSCATVLLPLATTLLSRCRCSGTLPTLYRR